MDGGRMLEAVRKQSRACARLGSPLYADLLERLADDLAGGGPAAPVLAGHENDPVDDLLALRLAGTVHRLALSGEAPELAAHYPSCGGDGDAEQAWPALRRILAERPDEVRAGLVSPPQTNEVGRAAPLLGALLGVASAHPLPVRLWEIGASGGLNLRAEQFGYRATDGTSWGPQTSPVLLSPAWDVVPPGPVELEVVERVGGDLSPLDATSADGALTLTSYVWPDQVHRLQRLRGAIEVAKAHRARLVHAGAAELLRDLELVDGTLTVVWHSVTWQYLRPDERAEVLSRLDDVGRRATSRKALAHIAFEPGGAVFDVRDRFVVTARTWPDGDETLLGDAPPHGLPVTWTTEGTAAAAAEAR